MTKTFRLIGMALFAMVLCISFYSCSSDDDEIGDVSNIIGTWQITHSKGWYINEDDEKETWDDDESDTRYVFDEEGYVDELSYSSYTKSWRGNTGYKYTIKGNKLYLDEEEYTIKRLNDMTMILVYSESDFYDEETFVKVE